MCPTRSAQAEERHETTPSTVSNRPFPTTFQGKTRVCRTLAKLYKLLDFLSCSCITHLLKALSQRATERTSLISSHASVIRRKIPIFSAERNRLIPFGWSCDKWLGLPIATEWQKDEFCLRSNTHAFSPLRLGTTFSARINMRIAASKASGQVISRFLSNDHFRAILRRSSIRARSRRIDTGRDTLFQSLGDGNDWLI